MFIYIYILYTTYTTEKKSPSNYNSENSYIEWFTHTADLFRGGDGNKSDGMVLKFIITNLPGV